jgi:hypothetical protein
LLFRALGNPNRSRQAGSFDFPERGLTIVQLDPDMADQAPQNLSPVRASMQEVRKLAESLGVGSATAIRDIAYNLKGPDSAYGFPWMNRVGEITKPEARVNNAGAAAAAPGTLNRYLRNVQREPRSRWIAFPDRALGHVPPHRHECAGDDDHPLFLHEVGRVEGLRAMARAWITPPGYTALSRFPCGFCWSEDIFCSKHLLL